MNFPADLKYVKSHEWAKVEGDIVTVGITDFAQSELGDVVFVDLTAAVGDTLNAGDVFGTIEAVKTVSDLYIPMSGTVLEINESLGDAPEMINTSPYDDGWMVKIRLSSPEEIDELLSAGDYQDFIEKD